MEQHFLLSFSLEMAISFPISLPSTQPELAGIVKMNFQ